MTRETQASAAEIEIPEGFIAPDYDAGLLNDFGGGDVNWWQDYLRAEIERANEHWREHMGQSAAELTTLRSALARAEEREAGLRDALANGRYFIALHLSDLLGDFCVRDDEGCPRRETMDEDERAIVAEVDAMLAALDAALALRPTPEPARTAGDIDGGPAK